jgi:hypothetical protein
MTSQADAAHALALEIQAFLLDDHYNNNAKYNDDDVDYSGFDVDDNDNESILVPAPQLAPLACLAAVHRLTVLLLAAESPMRHARLVARIYAAPLVRQCTRLLLVTGGGGRGGVCVPAVRLLSDLATHASFVLSSDAAAAVDVCFALLRAPAPYLRLEITDFLAQHAERLAALLCSSTKTTTTTTTTLVTKTTATATALKRVKRVLAAFVGGATARHVALTLRLLSTPETLAIPPDIKSNGGGGGVGMPAASRAACARRIATRLLCIVDAVMPSPAARRVVAAADFTSLLAPRPPLTAAHATVARRVRGLAEGNYSTN